MAYIPLDDKIAIYNNKLVKIGEINCSLVDEQSQLLWTKAGIFLFNGEKTFLLNKK